MFLFGVCCFVGFVGDYYEQYIGFYVVVGFFCCLYYVCGGWGKGCWCVDFFVKVKVVVCMLGGEGYFGIVLFGVDYFYWL